MRFIKLLLTLLSIAFFDSNANATEIIGGSFRYAALGNQKYKVVGIINRNCGGPALAMPTFMVYSGNASYNLTVARTSIKDITRICSKSALPCSPANTQTSEGQEQHTFEATLDFGTAPYNAFYSAGKCQVLFSMEACCRSSQTTNITANNFYLEAMLNLCVLGNALENTNANPNYLPITYLEMCGNLQSAYNYSYSQDEDSLVHEIITPKKTKIVLKNSMVSSTQNIP